jgi:glycosidase
VIKGFTHPSALFDLYDERNLQGSQRQLGIYHVAVLDDHDMSSRPSKERIGANSEAIPHRYERTAHAVGMMLTMLGIPSLYYGTEQALDGSQNYHDYAIEPEHASYRSLIFENVMFGGKFGAFGTEGRHFFNPRPSHLSSYCGDHPCS